MSESLIQKLARIELAIEGLQSKPIVKQVDYSEAISELQSRKNNKQIDYSEDINSIKKELSDIRKLIQNKKEFDFKVEFEKHATLDFINKLYGK